MGWKESAGKDFLKSSLEEVYDDRDGSSTERYRNLRNIFKDQFSTYPEFYARVPGRVTPIGDHIDYCGYAVLTMAMEQDVIIAAGRNNDKMLRISNTEKNFQGYEVDVDTFEIGGNKWYEYVLSGMKAVADHFQLPNAVGINLMVNGTVPKSAGLSSSSSLVCCAALTSLFANRKDCSKTELAGVCTRAERLLGAEVGEMDHVISFMAEAGKATLIEFDPVRTIAVTLPPQAAFVIVHSLVELTKADHPSSFFNVRVAESRLAAMVLAKALGLDWRSVKNHSQVQESVGKSFSKMLSLVEEHLHEDPYSREEIANILELSDEEMDYACLGAEVDVFKLLQRSRHSYSEASRVYRFQAVCNRCPTDVLEQLGEILNEAHTSLRDMYECSCDELNELVEVSRKSGAIGSRMIGAGLGGFTISLVHIDDVDAFIERVKDGYYNIDQERKSNVNRNVLLVSPHSGGAVFPHLFV